MYNLYDVKRSDDGLNYTFTTRSNIEYQIALISYPLGDVSAFSLSLYPESDPSTAPDYWIKNTVINIIGEILKNDSNSVFYVCDTADGRQNKRHLAFEYWFQKSNSEYKYVKKYDYCIVSENGYPINASILLNVNNPLANYLIEAFEKAMEEN